MIAPIDVDTSTIVVFFSVEDGEEFLLAVEQEGDVFQLVTNDPRIVPQMHELARDATEHAGIGYRAYQYTNRTDITPALTGE